MERWEGSLINRLIERDYVDGKIEIGTGVTELCYSDRHAFFITDIIRNKKGEIRELEITGAWLNAHGDGYYDISREKKEGYHQSYPGTYRIKKNRRGEFTSNGKVDGTLYRIGTADEYYDPHF